MANLEIERDVDHDPHRTAVHAGGTTGSVTVYPIPTANSTPYRVESGDGGIWFTEQAAAQIGRVVLR